MKKVIVSTCIVALLAGCGTPGMFKKITGQVDKSTKKIEEARAKYSVAGTPLISYESGAWLARQSIAKDVTTILPPAFTQPASFASGKSLPLSLVTDQIAITHSITIRLARDIFTVGMPGENKGSERGRGSSGRESDRQGDSSRGSFNDLDPQVKINYTGTLKGLLDTLAVQSGTYWNYRNGVVEFARLMTRTFEIKTMPGTSTFSAQVGKSASSSAEGKSGAAISYGSNASVSVSSDMKYWDEISTTVKSMLSPVGRSTTSAVTSSITVTDTADVVEQVARYIESENASLARQVSLRVQVYSVQLSENTASGIDWNLAYRTALDSAGQAGVDVGVRAAESLKGLGATLATSKAGDPARFTIRSLSGPFAGSNFILKALSQQGKLSTVVDTTVVTLNSQPAPVAVTNNVGYVSQFSVTKDNSSNGSGSNTYTAQQSVLTTGFVMNLLPVLLSNRSVLLQVQLDMSNAGKFDVVSLGKDGEQIKLPSTTAIQTMQRAALKSGDMLVLSGFRRMVNEATRDGLINYRGGTDTGKQTIEEVIIMISPELTEGV